MSNDIFTGYFDNSASTTGYFAYKADIIPATSTGQFTFSLFSNLTALNGLSFSGVSGKYMMLLATLFTLTFQIKNFLLAETYLRATLIFL